VKNALEVLDDQDAVVSVHDAVRPLASPELISRCLKGAMEKGNAVPVIPVEDTIREIQGGSRIIDRSKLFRIQTPQSFDLLLLKEAYQQPYQPHFTDDASLVEELGEEVHFVDGERFNLKLTHPEDLALMEAILKTIK
jgi:2-C-methyl-D-erythritol 4-phosphate cytidylyltransferase